MMRARIDENTFEVSLDAQGQPSLAGKALKWDLKRMENGTYSILVANRSYTLQLRSFEGDKKCMTLEINGTPYRVTYQDELDLLLEKMGFSSASRKGVSALKAPMPGKVSSLAVSEGQHVKEGDVLLVLEAMKMENTLKSPSAGVLEKIAISVGQNVEKNQLLIQFK